MFGFKRQTRGQDLVLALHSHVVEASRQPVLYGEGGLPDTVEGRFEALVLHVLVVLRRLRQLPAPADDVAQELVDAVFAHLEIALREMGIGDFGVPKRMKKLASAFFDRTSKYDPLIASRDVEGLAAEVSARLGCDPGSLRRFAATVIASDGGFAGLDLDTLLRGPTFARITDADAEDISATETKP